MLYWLFRSMKKPTVTTPTVKPVLPAPPPGMTVEEILAELESWYDLFYIGGGSMEVDYYVWEELIEKIRGKDSKG